METIAYNIQSEQAGERIDKALAAINEDWSRSQIQAWIQDGSILVNGEKVKRNYKVVDGDSVVVQIPEPEEIDLIPEPMNLDIYFEDRDVVVVNKPRGMVVHPAPGHPTGTLVNGLLAHCDDLSGINGKIRPGVVHRIDKDTSGLLMIAKNDFSHERLVKQLQEKTVTRKYQAIVHGVIPHEVGTIDAPIGRDEKDRQRMAVVDNGRHAVTHFTVIERFKDFTLVECLLETGRTHQIRVHMKYIGYPIAGDPKYGPRKTLDIEGQALHAEVLGFEHPRTEEYVEFRAPVPEEILKLIEELRQT